MKTSILESADGEDEEPELEMIHENDYGDEDLEELVTVEHVKQKLGGLLDQLENIKRAKGDMKQILKSQKVQRRVAGMEYDEEEEQKQEEQEEKEYFNKLLMRPLLDFNHKEEKLRLMMEKKIENKKPKDDEFNFYIMQAYKLSKRKEAALDELTEDGIQMFTPMDQDPRTISLKSKLMEKAPRAEHEFERQQSLTKKRRASMRSE